MAEEIQQHLDLLTERNIAAGMSPKAARAAAVREFGDVEQIKEIAREQRVWMWPEQFLQDLRFGVRMLWRSPGFSILAILCLTLGIGTSAAVFSWIEGILIRPYPLVAHQDRMFALRGTTRGVTGGNPLSYPDFLDLERNSTLFESFIVDKITGTTLSVGDRAERWIGGIVSANYFDALGVRPILGRGFRPEEGTGRNAHPVTVISYRTWKDRYKGDPEIIGKTQYMNGVQHTIIGVAPEKFHGTFIGYSFNFWVPTSMQEAFSLSYKLEDRGARWIESYAFLKPAVTHQQAQAELDSIAQRFENDYPDTGRGHGFQLWPLWKTPFNATRDLGPTLAITTGVAFFVLLIGCANVSNLLLARSLLRRHEMTMRLALGAGRWRLIKQLFTEGLLLSLIAAVGGIMVAYWCRNALVVVAPTRTPGVTIDYPGQLDWRVMAVSVAVCIGSTILFALVPAIQASDVDLSGALKSEGGGLVAASGRSRLRSVLVFVQVSLSFVLIAGTGLLLKSLVQMQNSDPGFSTRNVVVSSVDLFSAGYKPDRAKIFYEQLLERVRTLSGVQLATLEGDRPFSYAGYSSAPLEIEGYQPPRNEQVAAEYNQVGEGYFAAIGIPIVTGREFIRNDDENAPLVAIVNETMAAKYWPGKNAIGQRLKVKDRWMEVVGLAKDSKYQAMLETPKPFFYVPIRQNFFVQDGLIIRTEQSAAAIMNALAREIHALNPNLAPLDTISLQQQVDRMSYTQRLAATLLAIFGGMALFLASIGLYAVMSYSVSQSTRELGLRMALGAGVTDLLRLVMSRGLVLTAGGVLLGAIVALGLTRLMGNLLYKVSPRDPLAFGVAFVVMTIVALIACFLPAWRATRIDPVRSLRV
jgi:macrolide transport system ATP-binding/permease protein